MSKSMNNKLKNPDHISFVDEDNQVIKTIARVPWKILIVDDEKEIHNVTKLRD